jgi:type 2 lantibiotic biosynthesis protein LanM
MQFSRKDLIEIVENSSTIHERMDSKFVVSLAAENSATANSRLEQWCQVVAQGDWEKFERYLVWEGLDLRMARSVLGSITISDKQKLPAWTETLNECLKVSAGMVMEDLEKGTSDKNRCLDRSQPVPFEEVLLPFVYVARQKLVTQTGFAYDLLSEQAHALLEHDLLRQLSNICSLSMALEFSIFRAIRQPTASRLLEKSPDENSNKQYRDFIEGMLSGGLINFFREYSVLARLMATVIELWVDAKGEFLWRLESDWAEIQRAFSAEIKLGKVIAIEPSLSDRHNNGRSVMAVRFASGLILIYKPRNLGLDSAYFKVLDWINEQGFFLPFKTIKVINRSTYGWVEYVKASPCQDGDEIKRYYQRAGAFLCLVHILGATDLHIENIIASGEQPVLIDLETLMHPLVKDGKDLEQSGKIRFLAEHHLLRSVLRTSLLPYWQFSLENGNYDISGLGGDSQQRTLVQVLNWSNINTDTMAWAYEYEETQLNTHIPSPSHVNLLLNEYHEEIVSGFREMYSFITNHRPALLALDSPFYAFSNQQVRFVFRATKIYSYILERTRNPKFLRNGADRSIQIGLLSRVMFGSECSKTTKPFFWPVLAVEQQSLEQLDVPLFTANSNSDALILSTENKINNYFTEESFKTIVSHLNQLNVNDLEQQINIIRGSLYARIVGERNHISLVDRLSVESKMVFTLTQGKIVKQAIAIATKLQELAICSQDGSATWISPEYIPEAQGFFLQPIADNLYNGNCGVGLFLAALEKVTGGVGFRSLTMACLQDIRHNLQSATSVQIVKRMGLGGLAECGSILYGLVRISQFLESPVLLENAKQAASLITFDMITADDQFDVLFGVAGAILGLLFLHDSFVEQDILDKATICGEHLLNSRIASDSGYRAWATLDGKLLTGFSHGATGIAYALLRLYKATGETRFKEAAEEAITYERSVFIPKLGNWPDFRQQQTKNHPKCMCSWCHGASGIGLARVAALDILDSPEIRQDIEAAINTTLNYRLSDIDHLCCGNMGRLEFLFTAGRKLNRPELIDSAMKLASQVVAHAEQKGHYGYGLILDFHPGFFQGASGIGYELLRLAYPDILPSVLLWE